MDSERMIRVINDDGTTTVMSLMLVLRSFAMTDEELQALEAGDRVTLEANVTVEQIAA